MAILQTGKHKKVGKPRKPEISPTKLRMYLGCQLMYKLVYITRVGRYYYSPNIGDSFGGSLHRALNDFHAAGGHETQTPEQLVERMKNTWVGAGYNSREEEKEYIEFGAKILEEYYENLKSVESTTLFTECRLKYDMGDFALVGRIDRLDERSDGALEVIDYKTGRRDVTNEEVANDLAMSIYQLLVKKNYPGKRVVATIQCLSNGRSATAELSDEELLELEEMIRKVAAEMLVITEGTEIPPVRNNICGGCSFFKICERRARISGQEWEAEK
ncbi:MAG: PD-(D/E)XK nuclease family protein [Armatimonadota bacterium]